MNNEKIKKYAILLISILAAVLIIWQNSDREIEQTESITSDEEPNFFIVKGKYTVFDANGEISSVMQSDEAKHYPNRNSAILKKPDLLVYREDTPPWRLTADNGEYDMTKESLILSQNVVITKEDELAAPWTLKTESLTYLNNSRFITTKQPVTISDNISVLDGIGMNAWVDDKKIELTSNVRGNYAPE